VDLRQAAIDRLKTYDEVLRRRLKELEGVGYGMPVALLEALGREGGSWSREPVSKEGRSLAGW